MKNGMVVNWWWQDFYHQLVKCDVKFGKNKAPIGVNLFSVPFFEKLLSPPFDQHLSDMSCVFSNKHVVLEHMLTKFLRVLQKVFQVFTKKKVVFRTNAREGVGEKQLTWTKVAQRMSSRTLHKTNVRVIYMMDVRDTVVPETSSAGKTIYLHFGAASQRVDAVSCLTPCNRMDSAILTSRFSAKVSEKNVLEFIQPRVWTNGDVFSNCCFKKLFTNNKMRFLNAAMLESFATHLRSNNEEDLYSIVVTHTTRTRDAIEHTLLLHFKPEELFFCDGRDIKLNKNVRR
jgi:hypothetical protein